MFSSVKKGFVEVICGPMFAGKTTELIKRIEFLKLSGFSFLVFKPQIDNRYSVENELITHNFKTFPSLIIKESLEILNFVNKKTEYLVLDEAQFFDNKIEKILNDLSYQGINIIIGGLDLDFCGRPFGSMQYLLSISDKVTKLKSCCAVCGEEASRTQRIVDGKIPKNNETIILIGGNNFHEPRCKKCHKFFKF
ncbi:thymidine kinase [Texas Phoenix palm phytoplasma]|uniref:Thymidine kinase n=1 Tax=Texas Phoenix palm phytoplasma TaxID=176709 RepID=A0ABS5BI95_9MOLU|nr:thymidine kinase [Texas Phoenix palm phytoplasma]MBP3059296.1 thymidine kinase [Texas Phoenix palm phytoplasma]